MNDQLDLKSIEKTFTNKQGYKIFHQSWKVQNPKANLFIIHGIAEHADRYLHVVNFFNQNGISVFAPDLQGHGRSEGIRCNIKRYDDFLNDIEQYHEVIKEELSNAPTFVFGHSMGGGLVATMAIQNRLQVKGVLLSAAMLKVNEEISPLLQKLSPIISAIAPQLKTVKLDTSHLSSIPEVVQKYNDDPMVYSDGLKARIAAEMLKLTKYIQSNMSQFDYPVLIMHGSLDKVTKTTGSQMLFDQAHSSDKQLKIYEGLEHEILNEPENKKVMQDMLEFILNRI
ncbi:MAG: lysophospholipase [Bacteroidota bacterium]